MDQLYLHADMLHSHDVNDVSDYQLMQGDCWEHFSPAEDAEDSDTVPGDSDERQRDSTCLRPPQIYIQLPLPLLLLFFTSPSPSS